MIFYDSCVVSTALNIYLNYFPFILKREVVSLNVNFYINPFQHLSFQVQITIFINPLGFKEPSRLVFCIETNDEDSNYLYRSISNCFKQ